MNGEARAPVSRALGAWALAATFELAGFAVGLRQAHWGEARWPLFDALTALPPALALFYLAASLRDSPAKQSLVRVIFGVSALAWALGDAGALAGLPRALVSLGGWLHDGEAMLCAFAFTELARSRGLPVPRALGPILALVVVVKIVLLGASPASDAFGPASFAALVQRLMLVGLAALAARVARARHDHSS